MSNKNTKDDYLEYETIHFPDINEKIIELMQLNQYIKNGQSDLTDQRDRLIYTIIYHSTFSTAISFKALEKIRMIDFNAGYDISSVQTILEELAAHILAKPTADYIIKNPEAYIYSFLFKKKKYKNEAGEIISYDYVDLAFRDWIKKSTSFFLKEQRNRTINMTVDGEDETTTLLSIASDNYAYNQWLLNGDDYDRIDKPEEPDPDETVVTKNGVTYFYRSYNLKKIYSDKNQEYWIRYLRNLILKKLTYKQKQIIELHYYKNLSFQAIADRLKIDITNIRRRHNNAIKRLQEELFESEFYRQYPEVEEKLFREKSISNIGYIFKSEPYSPLIIELIRKKIRNN